MTSGGIRLVRFPRAPRIVSFLKAVFVLFRTVFLQVRGQAVNVKNALPKRLGQALLSSVRKEMEVPRKSKSVRATVARLAKATRKST